MPASLRSTVSFLALFLLALPSARADEPIYQRGFLSVEDAQRSIELPPGYSLELLLAEPEIDEPVAVAWDGNGAMYVVEMNTYMQDIDATGEGDEKSRITKHVDTDGDGTYDKHSVYVDNLKLPRMLLPLDDRVLVGITGTLDLWTYRDSDGDGKADEKKKVYEGGPRGGNMEHQPSGLVWAIDNWIYITYQNVRYRFTDGELEVERIPRGGGQWGLTQDDHGRLYYSTGGGENPAMYFQQPPQYGMLDAREQTTRDFRTVYPIANVPDVQGGRRRVNATGGVNHMTGCAGQGIFRGDRLPGELRGQLFIPEPVGRLVRVSKVDRTDGFTQLSNLTPKSEFMRAKDVNFRPLGAKTMPDGRLAIVDMHRGIIQQGNWVGKGSYLRGVVQEWGLDKNIGKGRIYRLVHEDFEPGPQPRMMDQSTRELVLHLNHPNGWWRDTAQRMIILRDDRESVVPLLQNIVREGEKSLARLHALWTLEGIGALSPDDVLVALKDSDPHVVAAGVRNAEPFINADDASVTKAVVALKDHAHGEVYLQVANSLAYAAPDQDELLAVVTEIENAKPDHPVLAAAKGARAAAVNARIAQAEQAKRNAAFGKVMDHGKTVYQQLCFTCHGNDGKGMNVPGQDLYLAPSFVGSARIAGSGASTVRTVLHGLSGPVDGKTYPGVMAPMHMNDDKWIAAVTTYVQNEFGPAGKKGQEIKPEFVAAIRKEHKDRSTPFTIAQLEELEPPKLADRKSWTFTASHNQAGCDALVDGDHKTRYTTNTPQKPGQWLRIELPEPSAINRIVLDTRRSGDDYPRGYEVRVSDDGKDWSDPVLDGQGQQAITDLAFASLKTKHIEIKQTGQVGNKYWSIHELDIYGKPVQ